MVFPDLNEIKYSTNKFKPSVPIRGLSVIIDYFIFAPVISFVLLVLFRNGLDIYKSFPSSAEAGSIFGILIIGFVVVATFFQALFITFLGATPGQHFLKLKIEFNITSRNENYPIFLQAWTRQIGFVASFMLLGIPFLKVLADENGQCFYEKMTDSQVVSMYPAPITLASQSFEIDRKFWSASLAALNAFLIFFAAVVFWKNYQNVLTSPSSYAKLKNKKKTCMEFISLNPTDRLRFAIAMNLVGTASDVCLDQEADFVLWRNFTDDQSLAYFAKFVSTKSEELESNYLKEACVDSQKSEGCYWAQIFINNDFKSISKNEEMNETILGQVLKYEAANKEDFKMRADLLGEMKKHSEFKSIKKYLVLENFEFLNQDTESSVKKRMPSSTGKTNTEKTQKSLLSPQEIKEMIDDL